MHRSRLTSALFDVPADAYDAELDFWSGAVGRGFAFEETEPDYAELEGPVSGLVLMVQRIGGNQPRLHLDIETDDVEAEVTRLEALGATRVEKIKTWWVMRDPAGLLFCVVQVQQPDLFETEATSWD